MSTSTITQAQYQSVLQATEQLTFIPGAQPANIVHSETTLTAQLNGSSSPPIAKVSVFVETLTTGGATLDLYADLKDGGGITITPTGLSVRAVKVQNPNAIALAITPDGGSNPYPLTFTVPPWSEITVYDTGAGGTDPSGTLSGTANGVFVAATNSTLTPSSSPTWTVNALVGKTIVVDGHPFTVLSNTATVATFTTNHSTDGTTVASATYDWNVATRANAIISATVRNLTLAGAGAQAVNVTFWLG